jgi:hypothetical protein
MSLLFNILVLLYFVSIISETSAYCIPPGFIGARTTLMNGYQNSYLTQGCGIDWPSTKIDFIPVTPEVDSTGPFSGYSVEKNLITFDISIENEWTNPQNYSLIFDTTTKYGITTYDKRLVLDPAKQMLREIASKKSIDAIVSSEFAELNDLIHIELQKENDKLGTGIKINWVRVAPPIIDAKLMEEYKSIVEHAVATKALNEKKKRDSISNDIIIQEHASKLRIAEDKAQSEREMSLKNALAARDKSMIDLNVTLETANVYYKKGMMEVEILERTWGIENFAQAQIANSTFPNLQVIGDSKVLVHKQLSNRKDNVHKENIHKDSNIQDIVGEYN